MKINLHPLSLLVFFPLTLCGMITDPEQQIDTYLQKEADIANSGIVRISQILLYGHQTNVFLNGTQLATNNWGVLANHNIEIPDKGFILDINGYTTDEYESCWRSLGLIRLLGLGVTRTMVHEQFKITPTTFTALTNTPKELKLGEWYQETETVVTEEYNPHHLGGSLIVQVYPNAKSMPHVQFMPGVYGLHLE